MDCKHLCDCIKIEKEAVKNKKNELTQASSSSAVVAPNNQSSSAKNCWKCSGRFLNTCCLVRVYVNFIIIQKKLNTRFCV